MAYNTLRMMNAFSPQPWQQNVNVGAVDPRVMRTAQQPSPYDFGMHFPQQQMAQAPPPDMSRLLTPPDNLATMGNAQLGMPPIRTMSDLYHPEMGAQNRFNDFIDTMPERENPSKLRRLGAVLYAMSQKDPIQAADQFTNYHYYNAVNDWKLKEKPLQEAADNERLANVNERQLAYGQMQNDVANRRIAETERHNVESEADRERLRKRQEAQLTLKAWVDENKAQLIKSDDGYVYTINPMTNKAVRTDVKHNDMSDMEKMNLGLANQITIQHIRQGDALEQIRARGDVDAGLIDKRANAGAYGGAGGKDMSPTQWNALVSGRARQGRSENPREWGPYMQFDTMNPDRFIGTTMPPGGSRDTLNRINDYIYGADSIGGPPKRPTLTIPSAGGVTPPTTGVKPPTTGVPKVGQRVGDADAANGFGQGQQVDVIPAAQGQQLADQRLRAQAFEALQSAKQPTTEANIKVYMDWLRKQSGRQ